MIPITQFKVSIIVPTYNLEHFIIETLDSITNQETHHTFEVLVVDDGSSDNTVALVRTYCQQHLNVKLLKNNRTKGVSGARNTGVLVAKGEWVAFLDGDDLWKKDNINRKLTAVLTYPKCEIISSGFIDWFYEEGIEESVRTDKELSPFIKRYPNEFVEVDDPVPTILNFPKLIHTGTIIFKRALLGKTSMFNEKYEMGEDRDLWLRLLVLSPTFLYLNEDLLLYRKRSESLTRRGIPGSVWAAKSLTNLMKKNEFKPYTKQLKMKSAEYQLKNSYYYRKEKSYYKAFNAALSSAFNNIYNIQAWKSLFSSLTRR